ncbi:MAG TPA: hypothetical protein VKT31_07165 [Solirubrobacteraceae bacterium]|nr:hypothetical protein [Solirubrobacteraceae bacterium]
MRIKLAAATALAALVGYTAAQALPGSARAQPAACHAVLSLVAHGQGSPDDLAWDGRRLLVSDINRGTVGVVTHGRVRTLISHLREPEGMVPGPHGTVIVAEQATNSVLEVDLANGTRVTLAKLPLPKGKSGIDGINADGRTAVFVPDSARGRLYVLHLQSRKLALVAKAMIRPVAATGWAGAVVVADEYANAVWRLGRTRTRLAKVGLPDDFAVISHHLIAVSLLGQVWEVAPHLRMLSSAFAPTATDPQGLAADGPDAVLVADQERNAIYRLGGLSGCL